MSALQLASKTILDATDSIFGNRSNRTKADALAISAVEGHEQRKLWNELIDHPLIDWGRDSKLSDEDGLIPPTDAAVHKACEVAITMRDLGWPLPTGVIPNGEGGIVFENRNDPSYQQLEIEEDGSMYLIAFEDCVFQSRNLVEIDSPGR